MNKVSHFTFIILIGFTSGIVNGLFGAGGGTIAVLALTLIFSVSQHKAQATAISIILPLSLISGFIYYRSGFTTMETTVKVAIGGVIGSYIGSNLLNKIPENYLRKIFGAFIIVSALRMVF
ncbi:permease [Alkaliphilus oremlandii OhILAs]|uniref:Probable membrane transporter protein n=2 Tax=Alkaliphilus oremlandii TaxID=461876 RepID=A8MHN8_ALKOO|nr:permease [Alkaliphilus oremlandii OhILAs]